MTLTGIILGQPLLVAALGIALELLLQFTRGIGYRRARAYAHVRRVIWPLLHAPFRRAGRPLLRDKTDRGDEFIATVDCGIFELLRVLWRAGFRWNPLSTLKFRRVDGRRQFAMSVAYLDGSDAPMQQDVHIFRNADGSWDLLGHWEPSPTDPDDHVGGSQQVPGDPQGIVRDALVAGDLLE